MTDSIYILSDIVGTLTYDDRLPRKLAALQENGMQIVVATDDSEESMYEYHIPYLDSLNLKIETNFICFDTFRLKKNNPEYWGRVLKSLKTNAGSVIFIDNDADHCENAKKQGIETIQYVNDEAQQCVDRLEQALAAKGCKPD